MPNPKTPKALSMRGAREKKRAKKMKPMWAVLRPSGKIYSAFYTARREAERDARDHNAAFPEQGPLRAAKLIESPKRGSRG